MNDDLQIHQLAAAALDHPFDCEFELAQARLRYRVEGRRRDGSVHGEHRIRMVGRTSASTAATLTRGARYAARRVAAAPVALLDSDLIEPPERTEILLVTGLPGSGAVAMADAMLASQRSVTGPAGPWVPWMVWSRQRVALVGVWGHGPGALVGLWSGEGFTMPSIDTAAGLLRWPDGSTFRLRLQAGRRQMLATQALV